MVIRIRRRLLAPPVLLLESRYPDIERGARQSTLRVGNRWPFGRIALSITSMGTERLWP